MHKVLHVGDPALTATLLVDEARRRDLDWKVLQLASTRPLGHPLATRIVRALRGVAWETQLAKNKLRRPHIHLHSALALPHVSWALGEYALHLHGTDIRTRQYDLRYRDRVLGAIREAHVVFYSTPDLAEHVAPHRPDAYFVPVPVPLVSRQRTDIAPVRPDIFFVSRWEDVKGGQQQINMATELVSRCPHLRIIGLNWGPLASRAADVGVELIDKMDHDRYLATIASSRVCVGQMSGFLGASELDAMAANIPLVAPLNPSWYDGSDPSLSDVPVFGRNREVDDTEGLTEDVLHAFEAPAITREWVNTYHSPRAAFDRVLAAYRETSIWTSSSPPR